MHIQNPEQYLALLIPIFGIVTTHSFYTTRSIKTQGKKALDILYNPSVVFQVKQLQV